MIKLWTILDEDSAPREDVVPSYLPAVIAGLAAPIVALVAHRWLQIDLPFLFELAAVIVTAAMGGFGPGIVTALIGLPLGVALGEGASQPVLSMDAIVVGIFALAIASAGEFVVNLRLLEREAAGQRVRRGEYLQTIFEGLPAPMLVIDARGVVLAANHAAIALFELGGAQTVDLAIEDMIHIPEQDRDATPIASIRRTIVRTMASGEAVAGMTRTGRAIELSLAIAATTAAREPTCTLYLRDETAERQEARRSAEMRVEIAQLGRAATLGAMGAAIAHELNQPLTSAANFAGTARAFLTVGERVGDALSATDDALEQIFRASAVLKGLRSFVQAAPFAPDWHDAGALLRDATRLAQFAVHEAHADILIEISEDIGEVFVDRIQVQQVLLNLIGNAADAVAGQPVRIVRMNAATIASGDLLIRVSDSGNGLSLQPQQELFRPFTTTKESGLGVGLAISQTIVEAHGGTIWHELGEAGGACFCFTLRRRVAGESALAA